MGRPVGFVGGSTGGGSAYGQPGSSPKQHAQHNTSPGGSSSSSSMKNLTQTPTNSGSRKSLVSVSKLEVRDYLIGFIHILNEYPYPSFCL